MSDNSNNNLTGYINYGICIECELFFDGNIQFAPYYEFELYYKRIQLITLFNVSFIKWMKRFKKLMKRDEKNGRMG